jgi:UDP-N-acetylmuramoyl-L-alanyl-D-glutamate--2,6-diaminopimelate ligase
MNIRQIHHLLSELTIRTTGMVTDALVSGISFDSRNVKKGNVFFAITGHLADGTRFVPDAIRSGASLIVLSEKSEPDPAIPEQVPCIYVSNVREALARAAGAFYDTPSRTSSCIAVTGTNGKTSTAWLVAQLLSEDTAPSMYIGTIGAHVFKGKTSEKLLDEGRTTFDPLTLNSLLAKSIITGVRAAVVEVTSHGLEQYRTAGMEWDVAAFSNLTQDHLDHHGTMEAYGEAKALLFFRELKESSKEHRAAVINIDDPFGASLAERILRELPEVCLLRVSERSKQAELYLKRVTQAPQSTTFSFVYGDREYTVTTGFIGSFYVTNMLLALGICIAKGSRPELLARKGASLKAVPGRLQLVTENYPRVFVDYAHTPDALEKVQQVLFEFLRDEAQRTSSIRGRLITVFGCGGDRDRSKRPLMGAVVARLSDVAVITSDNPRTEDPGQIIEDIMPGINQVRMQKDLEYHSMVDRRSAIEFALRHARKNDIVLIAGKGHEDYQEIHGVKYPFDDAVVVREIVSGMI